MKTHTIIFYVLYLAFAIFYLVNSICTGKVFPIVLASILIVLVAGQFYFTYRDSQKKE
jgi:hypothetical protein